jgi:hypothetical protein
MPLLLLAVGAAAGWAGASMVIQAPLLPAMNQKRISKGLKSFVGWLRDHLVVTATLGLWVLFVPAAFPVFTSWSQWPVVGRVAVLVTWSVAAVAVGLVAFYRDEETGNALKNLSDQEFIRILLAGGTSIQAILRTSKPGTEGCTLDVYVPTEHGEQLELLCSSRDVIGEVTWPFGKGVTGFAYSEEKFEINRRPEIVNDHYGLSAQQQLEYANSAVQVIAALPIWNSARRKIGALALISDQDSAYLQDREAVEADLGRLAIPVVRILIDILKVDSDGQKAGPSLDRDARRYLRRVQGLGQYS